MAAARRGTRRTVTSSDRGGMVSLFISHSSQDRAVAEWVVARLSSEGFAGLFLSFDPDLGIPVGRSWERELYVQLRKADAVVYLASTASVSSHWCFAELSLARSLGRPVFPLRVDSTARLRLLDEIQWLDLADGDSALDRLVADLRRAGFEAADSFAWDVTRSPYPGLEPFAPEDAGVFFGRTGETERLLELLQPTLQHGAGRFVAVIGPSGSGKSSLLHAGLLPRLHRRHHLWDVLHPFRPGRHPTRNLAGSLVEGFAAHGLARSVAGLERALQQGSEALVDLATELAQTGGEGRSVLLVLDQAEELLTRSGVAEQHDFLRLLSGALHEESPLWIVATVRSEFLTTSPERAGLTEAIDETVAVEPLSRPRLPEVIERPARQAGLDFAPGLIARMVEETAGGDALSLLAYTLRELYIRSGGGGMVTVADYEAVGGVVGALRRRADSLLDELTRRGRGDAVLPTLLKLAAVEGDQEPTRRRLPYSTLAADEQDVVDIFVEARLLVRGVTDGEELAVEVAHESLLRQWSPLRKAIDDSRHSLRLRSELERLAADWDRGGQDESYLLRGGRLAAFVNWATGHPAELGPLEGQFVGAGQALAARELAIAQRSKRRRRRLLAGLAALLALTLLAGGLAYLSDQRADSRARLALSDKLGTEANILVDGQPDLAILLGLQSLDVAQGDRAQPQLPAGLITGLARVTHASRLMVHSHQVQGAAFSPDGTLFATCGWDKSVHLWNTASGTRHGKPLVGHTGAVMDVAFQPHGSLLATASRDGTVRLWDVATGKAHGAPLRGHQGALQDLAFDPEGELLASASMDGTVRLWDVATGKPRGAPLRGHRDVVTGVAFSPNGRWLATASWDKTARLWQLGEDRPRQARVFTGHRDWLRRVEFSPDSRTVVTASADGRAGLWDVRTGNHKRWLSGHGGSDIWAAAFSPDGRRLATAGGDAKVRLWDPASGKALDQPLIGHTHLVNQVVFSPDSRRLVTTSWDRTARLWDVAPAYSVSRPLSGHRGDVNGVAFSPLGALLATAGDDATVRLWRTRAAAPAQARVLRGHGGPVYRMAFSSDGRLLASASLDNTVRLWDVASGKQHGQPLRGHQDGVMDVAFSRNGRMLATAAGDTKVRLWSVATGRRIGKPLVGHGESVNGVAFSPDSRLLASVSSDQTLRLWDVATHRPHGKPVAGHANAVTDVEFSPDGRLLATASADRLVRLWDVASGKPHGTTLTGHTGGVEALAFSRDGTLLAAAGDDGSVRTWKVATRRPAGPVLAGHRGEVYAVAFSPDGRRIASAGADDVARIWDRTFTAWREFGCRLVKRNLTVAEWRQYVPGTGYERTCPDLPSGQGAPD
ncbi:TIR domain-containing protein [Streptomyces sp. NPDC056486]|uniref:nSTAND1 domain-containing NTPase n=1 Tax=Streptomyces sp. NPDC056486 TaxID=3345835 RepID=UPI0036A6B7BA